MKLMIASYNNGTSTWNAEAEETTFIDYTITHRFNEPCEAHITIADATGTMAQKFNADTNDVYLGVGKVTIEDPTGTDIFYGRILQVNGNTDARTVELYCQDWMSQLDEEQITYDMREDLNGSGLRQSEVKSDVGDETVPVSQTFIYAKALDGAAYTTETTAANNDTADDMTLLPAVPVANDAYLFGFDTKQGFLNIDISTLGVGVWAITWEYFGVHIDGEACGDGHWLPLADVVDGTSGFTASGTVSWTIPGLGYWLSCTIDGLAKYWIRGRVSAYTSITTQPLGRQANQPQILYDDDMTFDADEFNGKYLIFPAEAAGEITVSAGPYADTLSIGIDTDNGGYAQLWVDDTNKHEMAEDDISWTVDYDFHINAELGSLYSAGPTAGTITLSYVAKVQNAAENGRKVYVKVKSAAEAYYIVDAIEMRSTTTNIRHQTFTIPVQYLTGLVDTLGEVTLQFEVEGGGGAGHTSTFEVYYCILGLTYGLEGTSSSYLITDTTANEIHTQANLTYEGLGIFEGCPYSVVQSFIYDSREDQTTLLLHPRVSATGLQREEFTSPQNAMQSARRGGTADKYIPAPVSNVVT